MLASWDSKASSQSARTLEAFAIYAVGFVARPIGAAIFGHYGDRIGRKSALIATAKCSPRTFSKVA